jgi:hypothetical protein
MPECYTAGPIEERTGIVDRHAEPGTDGGIPSLAQAARECLRRGTAWCGMRVGLDAGGAPVLGGDICFNADDGETPRYAVAGKNTAGVALVGLPAPNENGTSRHVGEKPRAQKCAPGSEKLPPSVLKPPKPPI